MRIAIVPNLAKPDAVAASYELERVLSGRAQVAVLREPTTETLHEANPELVVVLGGDGSLLRIAHTMAGLHAPVVGINFGKLGYLAAFSLDQFLEHLDLILSGRAPITNRLMLEGAVYSAATSAGGLKPLVDLVVEPPRFRCLALNDVVINSGEPFRMIELHVRIDDRQTTTFRSDGLIVSTSSGSTGYNLSAGGPLIAPDVAAMAMTPICPHSLSFRPVVLADTVAIVIHAHRVNPGTRVSFDGQVVQTLEEGECILVRRGSDPLKLVENPTMSHWQMLANKLSWAQSPRQRSTGRGAVGRGAGGES